MSDRNKQVGTLVEWTLAVDYAPIVAPASLGVATAPGIGQQVTPRAAATDRPLGAGPVPWPASVSRPDLGATSATPAPLAPRPAAYRDVDLALDALRPDLPPETALDALVFGLLCPRRHRSS
jgi:hypothetical protein